MFGLYAFFIEFHSMPMKNALLNCSTMKRLKGVPHLYEWDDQRDNAMNKRNKNSNFHLLRHGLCAPKYKSKKWSITIQAIAIYKPKNKKGPLPTLKCTP
uniref:Uncharacterized protein n=1 Tax=Amaranthus palmeri TaxID=107608 RepID=A0A6C0T5F4_AMAPA|nr:hypothetical protein AP_R.00g000300-v1.0.a3 [Amaranthus palmeri]